jgi:alkanesulfonate monooxygenase SsuD/methylene tetrahydromethanopterin reductase-like flavin-dependent oxidoreductase (luciferase family)
MRIGLVHLPDVPWEQAREHWRATEELGFAHAWTYDHLVWGGLPDARWGGATPLLAAAAGVTRAIELGSLVSSPNFRHPYQLFRDAQMLEDVSGGRFVLGLGAGGDVDSRVLGGDPMPLRERVDRFHEFVDLLVRLRQEDRVTVHGRWFSTEQARTVGRLDRTPYVVAANGPRSLRLAARTGDAWVTTGPPGDLAVEEWLAGVARSAEIFAAELADAGRDPATVRRYVITDAAPHLSEGGRYALSGVGFFTDLAGRIAELGFTDLVTHWPRTDAPYAGSVDVVEAVARDVLPDLQG